MTMPHDGMQRVVTECRVLGCLDSFSFAAFVKGACSGAVTCCMNLLFVLLSFIVAVSSGCCLGAPTYQTLQKGLPIFRVRLRLPSEAFQKETSKVELNPSKRMDQVPGLQLELAPQDVLRQFRGAFPALLGRLG